MTSFEAYDQLWPELQREIQNAAIPFDAYAVLRYSRKHGLQKTVAWIRYGNRDEAKRPLWRGQPNSYIAAKVKPLYAIR